jgi:NAD(P)-dependent dehydrogenase (short-subunit alcohol dehydrogenase family)
VFGAEEASTTLATNYTGTRDLTAALLPLMKEGGRIVTVSSRWGEKRRSTRREGGCCVY